MSTVIYPGPVFGPVRSRRLGKSLGVNLSPADGKICSFDCIYCECGLNDERRPKLKMPSREAVREALEARLIAMSEADDLPEAITYSGNGEPTSHPDFLNIVRDTLALRDRYCPQAKVCLLTNATHLNRDDVFEAVRLIDRPCLKLDTVDADYIRLVDRPNARYDVKEVIERIKALRGRCVVQTMFMQGSFAGQSEPCMNIEVPLPGKASTTRLKSMWDPGSRLCRRFVLRGSTSTPWHVKRRWWASKRLPSKRLRKSPHV